MKQNQYEIIVLDLDGTLTNRDKVITPRTKKALMEAQARGKKVVLASGRPTQGVMPLAEELDLKAYGGFILSYNGGRIMNCTTGEVVFSRELPVESNRTIIGLAEEEGAEAFFSALETGLTPEEQKKDKSTMPGMSENPFDKVYLVTPAGGDDEMTARLTEKAKYHFDAEMCTSIAEAVELAHANTRRGLLVCGGEAAALEAAELLVNS